ncbi:hypothetical protein HOLleu_04830 [Holothuria leucospilota]|uniref:Uncharacterized protein n=1 Tax=Holothuria leucospilota TaxID=206669 RepID=A0A9Q1CJ48_HOLLE|nr:hypothetical protein HOLleu_04830 [Holothuria leucospilota]
MLQNGLDHWSYMRFLIALIIYFRHYKVMFCKVYLISTGLNHVLYVHQMKVNLLQV